MSVRWVAAPTRTEALAALGIRDISHRCVHCGATDHGQPFAEGIGSLSLSHAGGLTLAAIADGPLGIDHEPIGAAAPANVVAHPSETGDPLRLWVRKEALLKATGRGLRLDPTSFWIDAEGRPSALSGYEGPPLAVVDIELDGFVAALAGRASYLLP